MHNICMQWWLYTALPQYHNLIVPSTGVCYSYKHILLYYNISTYTVDHVALASWLYSHNMLFINCNINLAAITL